jgi:hypothetical protein
MRAVNARLDLSRVSVFHAVGTRRGVHRARGSLCAFLRRATGLILEILVAGGQRTNQLARVRAGESWKLERARLNFVTK